MKKTKIICTLGPSTDNDDVLRKMILNGMNVARFNFSHGSYDDHTKRLNQLIKIRDELGLHIAALLDTKGPEIRLKCFKNRTEFLNEGDFFTLTSDDVDGDNTTCSVTYKEIASDVEVGTKILLDDGLIELVVVSIEKTNIVCKVLNSGEIKSNKSINIPGVKIKMPYISEKDRNDIIFGIENSFDFIAASFVSEAQDILEIRRILDEFKCDRIKIIAKIENAEGVNNIEEIISVSDGIMIARGDMGVEIALKEIPRIQKQIIHTCYNLGKPVITATQMLESMIHNPRPTRAEVTDIANAIYDGTSAIMLSGETAIGHYPVEAVETMSSIAICTESNIHYNKRFKNKEVDEHLSVADAMAHAACTNAIDIHAKAIIVVSKSGEASRLVCKYRPSQPIVACVLDNYVARQLAISWGLYPIVMPLVNSSDELLERSVAVSQSAGFVNNGDLVVIVAGVPVGISGTTNMIKAHLVGECLVSGIGVGKGIVTGRACVCNSNNDVIKKLKPGDILVVKSTSNDILQYIRNAAAIITEESGKNNHSGIVGMTLNIPVIVNAKNATCSLKDDMLITVDCERGIVRS